MPERPVQIVIKNRSIPSAINEQETSSIKSRYNTTIKIGKHSLTADEPENLGGKDEGPNPFEYVLSGLGTCMAITLRMYADNKQWPLEDVEIELNYYQEQLEDKSKKTFIEKKLILKGDLKNEQKEKLNEISKKCPVARMLSGEVLIN